MKVIVKRINFNEKSLNILDIVSNIIQDEYCNKSYLVRLKCIAGIQCELEIIGDNIYKKENIDKMNNEYVYIMMNTIDTPLIIKIIISNSVNSTKLIYIGEYNFSVITYDTHDEVNIENIITKLPITEIDTSPIEDDSNPLSGRDDDDDDDERNSDGDQDVEDYSGDECDEGDDSNDEKYEYYDSQLCMEKLDLCGVDATSHDTPNISIA